MATEILSALYSRLDPEITARTRRAMLEAKSTKGQSALEFVLFAVFGVMIAIAAIALIITNSAAFRSTPNRVDAGIRADRVNILVMQTYKPAKTNDVATDGIMLMSIKPSTHEVAVTSIPRDLWVKLGKYGQRRLGAAPLVASSAGYPGDGPGLTADTIESVFGQPVHAYVRIDRHDLLRAVSNVGGVDINVGQPVYEYGRHERFARGTQHMSGQRALRYAFSPFVLGPAADRFAREARQEEIFTTLFAKATEGGNASVLASLAGGDRSNLSAQQVAWLSSTIDGHQLRRVTLAPYMDTFEVATFAEEGVAVRPHHDDYRPLRATIANIFTPAHIASN